VNKKTITRSFSERRSLLPTITKSMGKNP